MRQLTTLTGIALALGLAAAPAMAQDWDAWDANGDGILDTEEFASGFGENDVYGSWDADQDGMLSEDEFNEGVFGSTTPTTAVPSRSLSTATSATTWATAACGTSDPEHRPGGGAAAPLPFSVTRPPGQRRLSLVTSRAAAMAAAQSACGAPPLLATSTIRFSTAPMPLCRPARRGSGLAR